VNLPVQLNADLIEAFAGIFLSDHYDGKSPVAQFHRAGWALYCQPVPQAGLAAPRKHAKSTAMTYVFSLAETLFRVSSYVIIISSTEEASAELISNMRAELAENLDLRQEFGVAALERDSTTDLIVRCDDGHRFRILARGAEQRIRGRLWMGKRPDLIICDDMEDDEQVENKDRRAKFRHWFFRAVKQALSMTGRIRVHGTVLHEDSLLARLRKNEAWKDHFLFYKAHTSFDDFSNILWPEARPEEWLRAQRQELVADGDAGGYAQEYLNDPQDNADAYLRKGDFLPMDGDDRLRSKVIYAAADFAVSKADLANRTSFTVGGKCSKNFIHIIDQRVERWASLDIELVNGLDVKSGWIMEMISIQRRWNPDFFFVEDGAIWKAVKRMVYNQLREEDCPINIVEIPSVRDKASRGQPLRKRHRSGMMRFDKEAEWYPGYEQEMLKFTGNRQATLDDQFDSTALLVSGFENYKPEAAEEDDFTADEELAILADAKYRRRGALAQADGRSQVTGY